MPFSIVPPTFCLSTAISSMKHVKRSLTNYLSSEEYRDILKKKLKKTKRTLTQWAGAAKYTDFISAEWYDSLTTVLDMTLNNLMVRLQ